MNINLAVFHFLRGLEQNNDIDILSIVISNNYDLSIIKQILNTRRVNINYQVNNSYTPLINAITVRDNIDIDKIILNHPELSEYDKDSIKYFSTIENIERVINITEDDIKMFKEADLYRCEVVKLLLDYPGIDVNIKIDKRRTALDICREYRRTEIIKLLIRHPTTDLDDFIKDTFSRKSYC